jgi:SAM-dependent methyltransferase
MTRLYAEEADLYDIAFDWDVAEEVVWLLERLAGARRVLEPGCGTGRILAELAARGVDAVGFDLSPSMMALADRRLHGAARVVHADMSDFALGETFDGAVCPIGTLGHLTPRAAAHHLECLARHLRPGAHYLVQIALRTDELLGGSSWEAARGDTRVKVDYDIIEADLARGISRERSRIAIVSGPRAGDVVEEEHEMTAWTPATWAQLVAASPFTQVAQWDATLPERPGVALGTPGPLMWHELILGNDPSIRR